MHALCDAFSRRHSRTTAAAAASKPPRLGLHAYYSEDMAEAERGDGEERAFVSAEEEEEEQEEEEEEEERRSAALSRTKRIFNVIGLAARI